MKATTEGFSQSEVDRLGDVRALVGQLYEVFYLFELLPLHFKDGHSQHTRGYLLDFCQSGASWVSISAFLYQKHFK